LNAAARASEHAGAPAGSPAVTLLWLESTREGVAARTHLDGTRARLASAGIPIAEVITAETSVGGILGKLRRLGGLVRRARRAARAGGVLVGRWHPFFAFVAPRWLRRGGGVVLLVQGNDESGYEANPWLRRVPGIRRLMRRSLVDASAILTVNAPLRDWVLAERAAEGAPAVPIAVIPQVVSRVFFEAEPIERDGEFALFFGGLALWQGIETLLAARADAAWPAELPLVVIGDGAMADTVREAVAARGDGGIEWLGALAPAEVARYAAAALVTLCPKSASPSMAKVTTPMKILESVAAGTPVIATDIPAQAEMLRDGYGILVGVDDHVALARAVARVHADRDLRAELAAAAARARAALEVDGAASLLAMMIVDVASGRSAESR